MQYHHPDNKHIEYKDWRSPELRKEGFFTWLKWRMRWNDLDHYMVNNSYRDASGDKSPTGEPMTDEQRLWFSLIFGMTYQSEMAWCIYWNFPHFWEIDFQELQEWNVTNLPRQKYAKDTKYNKGRITEQVKSMRECIEPYGSIRAFVDSFVVPGDENKSFFNLYDEIQKFHKFGRMTSWLALQALFETAGVPCRPDTMLATDPSNWSVRSGIMYVFNKEEKIEAKNKGDKIVFSPEEKQEILHFEQELYREGLEYIDEDKKDIFSFFLLESHLCQYKKLMLGGDYAGHSSGDHFSRYSLLSGLWPEVNYGAFLDAMENYHPLVRGKRENKELRDLCKYTGQMINLHEDFPTFPNLYKEYGIQSGLLNEERYKPVLKRIILDNQTESETLPLNGCVIDDSHIDTRGLF